MGRRQPPSACTSYPFPMAIGLAIKTTVSVHPQNQACLLLFSSDIAAQGDSVVKKGLDGT